VSGFDEHGLHAIRHSEVFHVAILRERRGARHEVRQIGAATAPPVIPYRDCHRSRSDHTEESEVNPENQPSREGARLSSGGQGEPARADTLAGAPIQTSFNKLSTRNATS